MKSTTTSPNPGKRVTLRDIAKYLDVSHATVSRALNGVGDPLISQRTIERVQQAAAELGYRPNQAARALATGRTGLIALWLWTEDHLGSYHAKVSQQMHLEAIRRSRQLIVEFVARPEVETGLNRFDAWNVDGIIAHEAAPAFKDLANLGSTPIVCTGTYHFVEGVDQVRIDLSVGTRQALDHLLESGRRRIAYLTDGLEMRSIDERRLVYMQTMEAIGRPMESIEAVGNRRGAREAIRSYVQEKGCPEAILCHNDDIAIGAYRGLCDLGIRVPDQVALVGCDGIEDCEYLEVPLTTIAQPFQELCALATQFLEQRIEDPTRALQSITLPTQLVVRNSS